MKTKKLKWLLIVGICLMFALSVAACNKNKPQPETDNSVVLYTFEQGILPVGMNANFGSLDINENAEFVKNGARSLILRPVSDGTSDPLMYFPFVSSSLGINYANGDKISEVKFWCYAPKSMSVNAGLYFSSAAGKRSFPTEIALQQGWNEAVYTLDHATLAVVNNMKNVQGFYLSFAKDSVPASENVTLYIDDLAIKPLEKELEYTPNIPELKKETGDVITFSTVNFGVIEQESAGVSDWLEEFEGASGVLQLEANTGWPWYRNRTFWKPAFEKTYYEDYTHLILRAYATGVCNAWYQLENRTNGIVEYEMSFKDGMVGRWVDFVLPIENFATYFDRFTTEAQFMTFGSAKAKVYVDSIRAVNPIEEEYAPNKTDVQTGDEFDLTIAKLAEDYAGVTFRYAVNGVYTENPSKYVFDKAGGYTISFEGVADGKLVRGEYALTVKIYGEQIEVDDISAGGGETVNLVPEKLTQNYANITFAFTVNGMRVADPTRYTLPNALGRYDVRFEGAGENGYTYYGSYVLSVGNKDEIWADVMTFETSATAPTGGDVTEAEWLPTYNGANGVLKMHVGEWKGYMNTSEWKPIFGKSVYDSYTHIAFRVKVEGFAGTSFTLYFKVKGSRAEDNAQYELNFNANTNGWTTVYLPIDVMKNNLNGFAEKTQFTFINVPESNDTQTYFYIDSIRAVNYAEVTTAPETAETKAGVAVSLIPEVYKNETFTYCVNGVAVADPGAHVFERAGTYTVTYDGTTAAQVVHGTYTLTVKVDGIEVTIDDVMIAAPGATNFNLAPDKLKTDYHDITFTFTVNETDIPDPSAYTAPAASGRYAVAFTGTAANGGIVYGSYTLYVGNKNEVAADIVTFDIDTSSSCTIVNGGIATFLETYEKASGVMKLKATDWATYTNVDWKPIFAKSGYESKYTHIALRVKVVGQQDGTLVVVYKENGNNSSEYKFKSTMSGWTGDGVAVPNTVDADGWTTIYLPINNLITYYAGFEAKTQILFYWDDGATKNADFYIDSIRAVKEKPAEQGTILDFVKNPLPLTDGGSTEDGFHPAEWLTDADANGYLKLNVRKGADTWTTYADTEDWLPAFEKNYYVDGGFDKIEFRVKVEGLTAENGSLNVYYGSGGKEYCLQFTQDTDGWVTLSFSIDVFIENFDTVFSPSGINFNSKNIDGSEVFFFIDSIKAVKSGN